VNVSFQMDDKLTHPVPLKMIESEGNYKLYAGKHWVTLKSQ
jgi:hypothetical protein